MEFILNKLKQKQKQKLSFVPYSCVSILFLHKSYFKYDYYFLQNKRLVMMIYSGIPGAPPPPPKKNTEQSIQSIFQDFALIKGYIFSPCWIEHLFLIVITPRSSYLVENFSFYE